RYTLSPYVYLIVYLGRKHLLLPRFLAEDSAEYEYIRDMRPTLLTEYCSERPEKHDFRDGCGVFFGGSIGLGSARACAWKLATVLRCDFGAARPRGRIPRDPATS